MTRNFLATIWPSAKFQWGLHYASYLLVMWLVHLAMISIIAFFHFQLGHGLSNIEDWVSYNAWEILVITKLTSFWIYYRFLTIRVESRFPVRLMLQRGVLPLSFRTFLPLLFISCFVFLVGSPKGVDAIHVNWIKVLWSYLGIGIFFGVDIFIFLTLQEIYPLTKRTHVAMDLVCALMLSIASYGIFPYVTGSRIILFTTLFITAYFTHIIERHKNWTLPVLYLGFVAGPLAALFGVDSVWGGRFAPFQMQNVIDPISCIVLVGALIIYRTLAFGENK